MHITNIEYKTKNKINIYINESVYFNYIKRHRAL